MADRHDDAVKRKALATEYTEKLRQREARTKESLTAAQYVFLKNQGEDDRIYYELARAMAKPDTVPSEYVAKKLGWLFDGIIPKDDKDAILYFADRLQEYPYSDTYARRSFRAKNNKAYASKLARMIQLYGLDYTCKVDAPLDKILNRELPADAQAYLDEYAWHGSGYTPWRLAYALDMGDSKVEEAVRRILTEENGSGMMTYDLVRGVLISHRSDLHELLGKLLVAARLQEGLRQAICENADYGTKAGFLTVLKAIEENRLIRFSSVKRAVGTWLGVLTRECRDLERVSEKSVRLIIECLESESVREEYLASEDAMKIHIALWSYGVDDIDTAIEKIVTIADSGTVHQLLVAGYFTANFDLPYASTRIAKTVLKKHHDKEDVLAVWLPCLIPTGVYALWNAVRNKRPVDYGDWFNSKEELEEFYLMMRKIYSALPNKAKTFSPCVFPWHEARLAKSDVAETLCTLAAMSNDSKTVDDACGLIKECSANRRDTCFSALLYAPKTPIQRKAVLDGLADKATYTRKAAYDIADGLKLTVEEYRAAEEHLRLKGADIRKRVMALLFKQGDTELTACIARLIDSNKEDVRLGGLDMLLQLKKDEKRKHLADHFTQALTEKAQAADIPSKERILLEALVPEVKATQAEAVTLFTPADKYLPNEFDADYIDTCVKTFESYFPESKLPELIKGKKSSTGILGRLKAAISDNVACKSAIVAAADLLSLSKLIEAHKTDSFVNASGDTVLVGDIQWGFEFREKGGKLPLTALWQEWVTARNVTNKRVVCAAVLYRAHAQSKLFPKACAELVRNVYGTGFDHGAELPHSAIIAEVIDHLCNCVPEETLNQLAVALTAWFMRCVPDDMVMVHTFITEKLPKHLAMAHLLAHSQFLLVYNWLLSKDRKNLKNVFPLAVASAERCVAAYKKLPKTDRFSSGGMHIWMPTTNERKLRKHFDDPFGADVLAGTNEYLIAAYEGIITEAELFEFLLDPDNIREAMEIVTAIATSYYEKGRQISAQNNYSFFRKERRVRDFLGKDGAPDDEDIKHIRFVAQVYETLIPVVLAAELTRGDSPAAYTKGISGIARVYGAEHLGDILAALGNDTLNRTAYYGWSTSTERKETLSYLLSVCIPADGDDADTLALALAGKNIRTKRLIEAALFSPEWIPIIGRYLGIDAFESVCYYFMAHMNEKFDDKRKAMIARYTPLSEEELNLGAFDVDWFRTAYSTIGEKEFELIYDAAKYISDGAKHSRARKYADASLGRFDVAETEKLLSDKRNKDLLMAYALIPLDGEDDICRRYLYIQQFRKESKQFGSQRIASEGKAVEMALKNLATNAGYSDTMRLTLRMETKVIDDSRALLEEHTVEGVAFKIQINENGKATLVAVKDGKQLKSVPARLKKHETVAALSAMVKTLTEQYRRTRVMLERAMEDSTPFTFGELTALSTHPVVYPMLKNLVLVCGDTVGFITDTGLTDDTGAVHPLDNSAAVKLAHPFDLYSKGCWRGYQKYLFDTKTAQPFRQVFRELYVKTAEELDALHSLRYAGNQIQPVKTVATLKSRRWVADIDAGLQKVYYKENIVAQIYALADWFSPADIEAPTLEWVCFTNRSTGEAVKIADVPDIVFSEVMRDVDLAVSVAHAGGVDPETSHSTMEMRAAILSFVLPMFRIKNVKVEGRHAIIDGALAEYSVHLGSGVVHQLGGAMIPVLPVHSQHRGKVFLPFVDDDPKTAEIISKVLLFAEDSKIKDPMILSAIQKQL